jgi:peptidoglycan/LPS O-acetylase OafA/YrhL
MRWLVHKHTAVLVVPIPLIVSLYFTSDWIPWTGIPTPQLGLTPHHSALAAFGTAFVFGWLLHRQQELLGTWARSWLVHCVAASLASFASIWIVGLTGDASAITTEGERMTYAAVYIFAAWNWVIAIVGFGVRFVSTPSRLWRYLADSSYWMYLVHLPLVFALQVAVMKWPIHWSVKFPSIVIVAFIVLLASYQALVRNTFVGLLLNGRRYPTAAAHSSMASIASTQP